MADGHTNPTQWAHLDGRAPAPLVQTSHMRPGSRLEANSEALALLLAARPELHVSTFPVLLVEATTWGA